MGKLILGYWDIRGLAEPARLMLEYGGIPYEDKRYKSGQEPPYDRSVWLDVKFTLGLDFPNLAYLMDEDIKLTESWAIYRYIGRKIGIMPTSVKAEAEADMLEGVIKTFRGGLTGVCYNDKFESMKAEMREKQEQRLQQFETFMHGRKFLLGDKITYIDFSFFESLDQHRLLFPDFLDKFEFTRAFVKRFESLDKIAAYRKSNRFRRFPILSPMAKWGGNYE